MNGLLSLILQKLEDVKGPDPKGNYTAYCPYHEDGHGKPPHSPNLSIHPTKGFNCFACGEHGNLGKLAEKLGIEQTKAEIESVYDYLRADGSLNYQAVRYNNPKTFKQRRPDGKGGYIWDMKGITRTLYKYPELLKRQNETVFIVEGEKDVETLWALGLLATTNSGGAGKWQEGYSETLKGRDVAIIPDNDAPGKAHGESVGASLHGKVKSIKIINLPGLNEKGDVSNWIAAGHDKGELLRLCDSTQPLKEAPGINHKASDYPLTDIGNAEHFENRYKGNAIFCHGPNNWHIWNRKKWAVDSTLEIQNLGSDLIKEIAVAAVENNDSDKVKKALSLQSYPKIKAMLELAKSKLKTEPGAFNTQSMLLNCQNGVLDSVNGTLMPHNPTLMLSKIANVEFDPNALCPQWERFLSEIMLGREDLIYFLQSLVGLSLTGDTSEQYFYILYGSGENGKSTFINTIMGMLGDYAITTPASAIMTKWNPDAIPHELAALPGIRMTSVSETSSGQKLNEQIIKQITGNDEIQVRRLHENLWRFKPICKFWMNTNHKPDIRGRDHAIWRRVILIPFEYQVKPDRKDPYLMDKLKAEWPGILNWALEGCQRWQEKGLEIPGVVKAAVKEYREDSDIFGRFISDTCIEDPHGEAKSSELWKYYIEWCAENKLETKSNTWFGKTLSESYKKDKDSKGTIKYCGLRIKSMQDTLKMATEGY
jgi:putative DNA primase/helicase